MVWDACNSRTTFRSGTDGDCFWGDGDSVGGSGSGFDDGGGSGFDDGSDCDGWGMADGWSNSWSDSWSDSWGYGCGGGDGYM